MNYNTIGPPKKIVGGTTGESPANKKPVVLATPVATQPPPCSDEPNTRILGAGPEVAFVNILKIALGGAVADYLVQVPIKAKVVMIVGCDNAHLTDTLFMHFNPLQKSYAGNSIIPVGNEQWFPFTSQFPASLSKIGSYYKFTKSIPEQLYFDIGQEAGGTNYFITLAFSNDIDIVQFYPMG